MNINKALCEKLYSEVKIKLRHEFVKRGMTYRDTDTSIWKLEVHHTHKTFFQLILEEATALSFSSTFNNMYLWRKKNEVQTKEFVNFQEDYLIFFTKFLGYANPQDYLKTFSLTLHNFFGIKEEGKIVVVQPVFDPNKEEHLARGGGKRPRIDEQTVDVQDTECLIELINLFHDYNQILPKRIYDQDIISINNQDEFILNEIVLNQNKPNCIFCIGFYSNYFFLWYLETQASGWLECTSNPYRFRVKYRNENLGEEVWTDYYQGNTDFDAGFLLKAPIKFKSGIIINCYFICGIKNKSTLSITNYLCKNWQTLKQKHDNEKNVPINENPFLMIFKVNETNNKEIYVEKIICIGSF